MKGGVVSAKAWGGGEGVKGKGSTLNPKTPEGEKLMENLGQKPRKSHFSCGKRERFFESVGW